MDGKPSSTGSRYAVWYVGVAAGALAWIGAAAVPALRLADNWLTDVGRIFIGPAPPAATDIAVVAITEETLATLAYRSPVNRALLAGIVEKAATAGAAGLAIDILFDQPTEEAADTRLRQALRDAAQQMRIAVAYATLDDRLTVDQLRYLDAFTDGLPRGVINLPDDADDRIVRWRQVSRADDSGGVLPGFVTALAGSPVEAQATGSVRIEPLVYSRTAPGVITHFTSYPAHALALLPDEWLAGKFLFVGADLPHADRHRTPFSALSEEAIPGVEIHAHGFNQVRSGVVLAEAPPWSALALALILGVSAAWSLGLQSRLAVRVALLAAVVVAYIGAVALALAYAGALMPVVAPVLAAFVAGGIQGGREWTSERHRRAFIQDAFSRYLSPAVVKLLADEPDRLRLGGEEREVTYVFTDLAGFTSLTEKTEPELLVDTLNRYLDNMCRIALDHEATIDKIVGDAVVAFYGAPLAQPDQARRAVKLALAYDRFAQAFRGDMKNRGLHIGVTRIGVHTGPAIVGNFGGNRFFNYTAHGDTVNTAARMESVNKHLGTRICVSEVTAMRCTDVVFRPIGTLVLVGKTRGLACSEPLADDNPGYAPLDDYAAAFAKMAADDPEAALLFQALAERFPADPLVALHAGRLAQGLSGARIVMSEK